MSSRFKVFRTRGPAFGFCRICGNYGALTEDHVPPKGASTLTKVEIHTLAQSLGGSTIKPAYSQNGVKFRTICSYCNNVTLGAKYDPCLIDLCSEIALFLRASIETRLYVGAERRFRAQPHKVARAVIGHLLAGCVSDDLEKPLIPAIVPDGLRACLQKDDAALPDELDIYYRLYPSKAQIILKYFGYADIRYSGSVIMGSLIKFFPLGFLLVWEKPKAVHIGHRSLFPTRDLDPDDCGELEVNFSDVPAPTWPESPGKYHYLLFNDSVSSRAQEKQKRR